MKKFRFFIAAAIIISVAIYVTRKKAEFIPFTNKHIDAKVEALMRGMSVEEKLVQLHGIRLSQLMENGKLSLDKCRKIIPNGIGHICQFACGVDLGPNELRDLVKELQNYLITETPSGIPAIFHEEAITGVAAKGATVYPQQLGVACTWNPDLAELKTEQTAVAMREIGGSLALSPMVDIIRSAHWPRIEESYGEDSYLSSRMGLAFVNGLQKKGLQNGVAACSKHFLGYGGGSESNDKELYEEILLPHEVLMRKGNTKVVMTGYHEFGGSYSVSNDTLIQDILRGYLGFDGIVVSDYSSVSREWTGNSPEQLKLRAVSAINAGNDLEFSEGISYPYLIQAIKEGLVSEKRFDEVVRRALTLKARLGMLEKGAKLYAEGNLNLDKPEYRKLAYELACQSQVLLKNNGVLPLSAELTRIALVGPNANTFWCMLGDYTYQSMYAFWWGGKIDPNNPKIGTLREALQSKLKKNISMEYERGCDWSSENEASVIRSGDGDPRTKALKLMLMESSDPANWKKAIEIASTSEIIIAAMGENPTLCGEGRERKGIRLPGDQERFIKELIATGKPVVLVLFGGRPQVIKEIESGCAAILQAWYPGEEGGNAVADILLGNVNPSGKLSVSYPGTEQKLKLCYNNGAAADSLISYPFGYGLSYTTYSYSNLILPEMAKITDDLIPISFSVKNTGGIAGTEIVQLYLSPLEEGSTMKPIQLKGFQRLELKPGEEKTVVLKVSQELLAEFKDKIWVIEPGRYSFLVAASSKEVRLEGILRLTGGKKVLSDGRKVYFSENSILSK